MAHRVNVVQVLDKIEAGEKNSSEVTDPVCGRHFERRKSNSMVFRPEGTIYFCSRECKERFVSRS